MRVFFAVPLPSDARREVREFADTVKPLLPRMKWVEEENLHLTLRFIGEVDEERLPLLIDAGRDAVHELHTFQAVLGELGAFPHSGKARVLWWGLKRGRDEAVQIFTRLEDELVKRGFESEKRAYHPHVTLARMRRPAPLALRELTPPGSLTAGVKAFVLYKSTLTPQGPIYEILEEFRLG